MKRLSFALVTLLYAILLNAQTQYDYYDDSAVAGGADRALNGFLFFVLLIIGAFIILLLGGVYYKIKYLFNPEESPEYKAKNRKGMQEKTNLQSKPNSASHIEKQILSNHDNFQGDYDFQKDKEIDPHNFDVNDNSTNTFNLQNHSTTKSNDKDFNKDCIEIYGDYAENTYGLVLVKEDGEYRQIAYSDKRYEVLSSYIFQNHPERHATTCKIGNGEQLKMYIQISKEYKLFPEAKPMESHGILEKEYYGERIAMMMAYYDDILGSYPVYSSNAHTLRDYCLALGWDLAIYIHRYIKQPMDWQIYYDLKDMTQRKMTKDEYLAYRTKADIVVDKGSEGVFDGWGNPISREENHQRWLDSYMQAINEVKEFKWEL